MQSIKVSTPGGQYLAIIKMMNNNYTIWIIHLSCTLPHLYHILVSTPKKLCNDGIFPTTILVNFQINYPHSPPFRADLPHSPVFSCLLRRFKLRE